MKISELCQLYGERELIAARTATGDIEVFELSRSVASAPPEDRHERLRYLRRHAVHVGTRNPGSQQWWVKTQRGWERVAVSRKGDAAHPFDCAAVLISS